MFNLVHGLGRNSAGEFLTRHPDVDAITLSMAEYARQSTAALTVAATAVTVAALSNTVVKCTLVFVLGGRALANKLLAATLVILALGLAVLFFV